MDEALKEAARQVPSLVVLVAVVVVFLRAGKQQAGDFGEMLSEQRRTFVEALKTRDLATGDIAEQCHAVTREATEAVRENSKVLGSVEHALDQAGQIMADTGRALRERSAERRTT